MLYVGRLVRDGIINMFKQYISTSHIMPVHKSKYMSLSVRESLPCLMSDRQLNINLQHDHLEFQGQNKFSDLKKHQDDFLKFTLAI